MSKKIGAIGKISIRDKDGNLKAEREISNVPNVQLFAIGPGNLRPQFVSFFLFNTSWRTDYDGTWSQSGTTVTRVSGTGSIPSTSNVLYVFADGTIAGFRTAGSGTSFTATKSQTVAAQAIYALDTSRSSSTGHSGDTGYSGSWWDENYSGGVYTLSTNQIIYFPEVSSAFTLRGVFWADRGDNPYEGGLFEVTPPVDLDAGDIVAIESFEYTLTYNISTPRVEPTTLTGTSGSITISRLTPAYGTYSRENQTTSASSCRIYLIDEANAITIPDMPATNRYTTSLLPGSLIETITPYEYTQDAASSSNDLIASPHVKGIVAVGGTVKQIVWGYSSYLWGIIEFATPVTVYPNQVIKVGGRSTHTYDL